ncbi:exportin-5-like isoform X2 [Lissotriton helveticus]
MTDMEVKNECENLTKAVNVIMDPKSTLLQRAEAQKFCDAFKENSPLGITCGLKLVEKTEPTIVRYFGLQILVHAIKHRWDKIPLNDKIFLKETVMHLIATGLKPVLEEEICIKDGYAHIVVEIIKLKERKTWSDKLVELQTLQSKGALQAEMVMLILLRLSEDVVMCDNCKLKNILQGRTQMLKLLYTVRYLLKDYSKTYRVLKNDAIQQPQAKACCQVINAALKTMASYLEWASLWHIIDGQNKLLETLLCFMDDPELQLEASQCLLVAVKRMAVQFTPGRKPLLLLFEDSSTPYIFSSAQLAAGEVLTDQRYFFMKIRCELLSVLGEQLCQVMNNEGCEEPPPNFGKYLDCLLDFTTQSSKYLSSLTQPTWLMFFKHTQLSRNPLFLALLPKYLLATRTNLIKMGFPSKNNHPSCEYSRLDFATDEDYYEFLATYRADLKETLEAVCKIDQRKCFQIASEFLKYHLLPSVKSEFIVEFASDDLTCSATLSFPQWEATTFFAKIIIANLFKNVKNTDIPVQDGIELLQLALNFTTKHPLILACIQTNISNLFPFLYFKTELVSHVLNKFLEIIEELKVPKEQSLMYMRRNAYSCINQICRDHSVLILPHFGILLDYVKRLLSDELQLTQMEGSTLMEAMFIMIKQLKHYDQQKALLEELMVPVVSLWQSTELQRAFSDSESFIKYVGADQQATFVTEGKDLNRSSIMFCVSAILGVLRWIRCPIDMKTAEVGGFVIGYTSTGHPILRNPCSELVLKLLDNLFILIRTQNNLYLPKVVAKLEAISAEGSPLDLLEVQSTSTMESETLNCIYDPPEYKTHLEKLQGFFCSLYNCCFYILGAAESSLKQDFYSMKILVDRIHKCAFVNLRFIPDFRLLTVIRCFIKPMASSCPPEYYENVLAPVLQYFFSALHARLSYKWKLIKELNLPIKEGTVPENSNCQNIDPEQVYQLTEEVLTFLTTSCGAANSLRSPVITNKPSDAQNTDAGIIVDEEDDGAQIMDGVTIFDAGNDGAWRSGPLVWASPLGERRNTTDASRSGPVGCSSPLGERRNTAEVVCYSNEDADYLVCAAESDDDDCVCSSDIISSSAAVDNDCYKAEDKAETSAAGEQCDVSYSISNENPDSLAQSYNAFIMSMKDADDSVMVAVESDEDAESSEDVEGSEDAEEVEDAEGGTDAQGSEDAVSDHVVLEANENADISSESDGEMAAETPPRAQSMPSELTGLSENIKLTTLGTCLLTDESVRLTLLRFAFESLGWNVLPCQKMVSDLCWPMLKQVIFEALPVESVTFYFSAVLKALQQMSYDKFSASALERLAFQMYLSLRPRYSKLAYVMKTVPHVKELYLKEFDQKLLNPTIKEPDSNLAYYFRRIFEDSTKVQVDTPAQLFKRAGPQPPRKRGPKKSRYGAAAKARKKFNMEVDLPDLATRLASRQSQE